MRRHYDNIDLRVPRLAEVRGFYERLLPALGFTRQLPVEGWLQFEAGDDGDSEFFGSTGDIRLNQPIVGMAPSKSGRGYRFVAADGGIFAFGDAGFSGSGGGMGLGQTVVGMLAG